MVWHTCQLWHACEVTADESFFPKTITTKSLYYYPSTKHWSTALYCASLYALSQNIACHCPNGKIFSWNPFNDRQYPEKNRLARGGNLPLILVIELSIFQCYLAHLTLCLVSNLISNSADDACFVDPSALIISDDMFEVYNFEAEEGILLESRKLLGTVSIYKLNFVSSNPPVTLEPANRCSGDPMEPWHHGLSILMGRCNCDANDVISCGLLLVSILKLSYNTIDEWLLLDFVKWWWKTPRPLSQ